MSKLSFDTQRNLLDIKSRIELINWANWKTVTTVRVSMKVKTVRRAKILLDLRSQ
jgi:hypothetical protein